MELSNKNMILLFILLTSIKESFQLQHGCDGHLSQTNCIKDAEKGNKTRCFYICGNKTPLSWTKAKDKCKNHREGSMTLAIDDTKQSHRFISELIRGRPAPVHKRDLNFRNIYNKSWLNGHYTTHQGTQKWCWHSTDGCIPISTKFWPSRELPRRNVADKVVFIYMTNNARFLWGSIDKNPGTISNYICEKAAPDYSSSSVPTTEDYMNPETSSEHKILTVATTELGKKDGGNYSASHSDSGSISSNNITLILSVIAVAVSINCAVLFLIYYCRKAKSTKRREEVELNDISKETVDVPHLDKSKNSLDATEEKIARLREISRYSIREVDDARSTLHTDKARVRFCSVLEQPDVVQCIYKDEGHTYQVIPDSAPIYHELGEIHKEECADSEQLVENVAYSSSDELENLNYKKVSIVDNDVCNNDTGAYSLAGQAVMMIENDVYTKSNVDSETVISDDVDAQSVDLVENEIYQTAEKLEQNDTTTEIHKESSQETPGDKLENSVVIEETEKCEDVEGLKEDEEDF